MATKITATELARNLSDVLNRVRYKGESFEVTRGGETIAEIKATERKRATLQDFIDLMRNGPKPDPEFWDDVEQAHNEMNQPLPMKSPWDTYSTRRCLSLWSDAAARSGCEDRQR